MVAHYDQTTNAVVHRAVNACITPVCAVDGMAVTTVEGIGSVKKGLHPCQERLGKAHGSQCGFCTPGIVMSMFSLLQSKEKPTQSEMEHAFDGNLCRCTGYRPIIEAYKTLCHPEAEVAAAAAGGGAAAAAAATTVGPNAAATARVLVDPGEFAPYDKSADPTFPAELLAKSKAGPPAALQIVGDRMTWHRPSTLTELLALKKAHPDAKIIVGNTEVALEIKFAGKKYPVMLSPTQVPELNTITTTDGGVVVGASVTLTDLGNHLKALVGSLPESKTRVFRAVLENLRWFAGEQIRNVSAIGGNVCTASPISDLNPIWVACGSVATAISEAGGERTIPFTEFFTGYRKTALTADELLLSISIPFTSEHEYIEAYKQARRRDDDIALVNGCFKVVVTPSPDGPTVSSARLCFGGMNRTIVSAEGAAAALVGKVWNQAAYEAAAGALEADLPVDVGAPPGISDCGSEYRRAVSVGFLLKYYLSVSQQVGLVVDAKEASATLRHHHTPSSGRQDWEDPLVGKGGIDSVGQNVTHVAALKQVSGEAIYTDDMPAYANELHGCIVFSTVAHAKLLSIDAAAALAMPGVEAFYSAKDVPGTNATGPIFKDEEVFISSTVTCTGQPIGIVVAATQQQAREAARAVQVKYEELTAIISIEQAIEAESFYMRDRTIQRGDLEAGFAASDHVIEGESRMGGQEHFYLETQGSIAVPKGEDGEMEVFASTQNPTETQVLVASALGVPENRIVCRVKRMGGGFGGKETRSAYVSTAAAVAANALGRPIRCCLERDEDMASSGGRHPFLGRYKVGFNKDGTINALEMKMYSNAGNSCDLSNPVMERGLFHLDNCYNIPNVRGVGFTCKTNLPSNTAFRGFGGPQGLFLAEHWMSDVARVCGLSQVAIRELNFYKEGELTHFNQKLEHLQIESVWNETKARAQYDARRKAVDAFNGQHRWRKRGLAILPTKFGVAFTALFMNQAGALIHIYHDGSVLLTHGGTEMGQGLHTKMIQVCARALGVPISEVHISETSTNTVPNTSPTAASASSDLNGMVSIVPN
jgi:xanthine dehydrogenase/oxidase